MAIEYFMCFNSYRKKTEKLSDQEVGRLFRALMDYSATGTAPALAGRESIAFDFIAADIDQQREAYEEKCRKNKEASDAAAEKRRSPPPTDTERDRPVPTDTERDPKHKHKHNIELPSPSGSVVNARARAKLPLPPEEEDNDTVTDNR